MRLRWVLRYFNFPFNVFIRACVYFCVWSLNTIMLWSRKSQNVLSSLFAFPLYRTLFAQSSHFFNFLKWFELVFQFASSPPLFCISFLYDSYSFWLSPLFNRARLLPSSSVHLPPSASALSVIMEMFLFLLFSQAEQTIERLAHHLYLELTSLINSWFLLRILNLSCAFYSCKA